MKILFKCCILFSAFLAQGCTSLRGFPEQAADPSSELSAIQPLINASAVANCLANETQQCRNTIITARLYAIDLQFSKFEESLFNESRTTGLVATLSTLGLTTAAATSSGGASVLSGISAFVIGSREAYQKEILAERTVVALHTAMRARRGEVSLRVRKGLSESTTDYPLGVALSDLNDYFTAGTVLGALVNITETVGANAQRVNEEIQELSFGTLDGNALKIRGAFKTDPAIIQKLQACFVQIGLRSDTNIKDFLFTSPYQSSRALAVSCLNL